jgi:hypothetical protein
MATLLNQKRVKARKTHYCDGYRYVEGSLDRGEAHDCKGAINKGQSYLNQVCADSGSVYNFRICDTCLDYINSHKIDLTEEI